MSTFAEMYAAVQDDLDRTDLTTQVQTAINRSISHYSASSFWFTETTGTFTTVADQLNYDVATDSIPDDIREIISVLVTVSGTQYQLMPKTIEWITNQDISNNTGQPTNFGFFQQQFYLYPVPDDAYTITVYYKKSYDELSADGDTNDFTTIPEAEELIENRAAWWMNARIIKDAEQAALAKQRELEALDVLLSLSSNFDSANNQVTATDF